MKILFLDGPYDGQWLNVYSEREGEPPYYYRVADPSYDKLRARTDAEKPIKIHTYESVSFVDTDHQVVSVFRYAPKEGRNKRKPVIQTLVNRYIRAKETSPSHNDAPELGAIDAPSNPEGNEVNVLFLGGPYDGKRVTVPRRFSGKPKATFQIRALKGYPKNVEWADATLLTWHQYDLSELMDIDGRIIYVYCYWPPGKNRRLPPIATLLEGYQRKIA